MALPNPIVQGNVLAIPAIESVDWETTQGASGWRIARNGDATFNNLVANNGSFFGSLQVVDPLTQNTLGGIDTNGNVTAIDGYFSDDVFAGGLGVTASAARSANIPRVPGGDVGGGIVDSLPYGMVAYGPFASNHGQTVPVGGYQGMVSQAFQAEAGRSYEIILSNFWIVAASTSGYHEVDLCWNLPASDGDQTAVTPTVGATTNMQDLHPTINTYHKCYAKFGPFQCGPGLDIPHAGLVQFILQMRYSGAQPTYQYPANTKSNTAMCNVYDIGPVIPATSGFLASTASGGGVAPTQQYSRTYTCSSSGSYDGGGSPIGSFGSEMNVGYNQSGTWGTQQSMACFPNMTGDLSGASIQSMSVTVHNHHWWNNGGGTVEIGLHGNTSLPGSFNIGVWPIITSSMSVGATKTFSIPSTYWAGFKAGTYRGINLHAPSSSATYYGRFDGQGYSYPPKISVTYTK